MNPARHPIPPSRGHTGAGFLPREGGAGVSFFSSSPGVTHATHGRAVGRRAATVTQPGAFRPRYARRVPAAIVICFSV